MTGNDFEYILEAKYGLFSNPSYSVGGEKCSYMVPTYEALKRATQNIYWKPTLIYVIDSCTVLNPIEYETKAINVVANMDISKRDLSFYTYLINIKYLVKGHFIWNENLPQFEKDRNVRKHKECFERFLRLGGRRAIYAGTSECPAYVYPVEGEPPVSYYKDTALYPIGYMYHSKGYPNENKDGEEKLFVYLSQIEMRNGVITYPEIEKCDKRVIRDMKFYNFEDKGEINESD